MNMYCICICTLEIYKSCRFSSHIVQHIKTRKNLMKIPYEKRAEHIQNTLKNEKTLGKY